MTKSNSYPSLDGLVDLACRDGVDVRPTLLRVLTDLYVQKPSHSADEEIQYIELAQGLVDTVDDATRAIVAARLSAYPAAPAAILNKLTGSVPSPSPEAPVEVKAGPDNLVELFFTAAGEERRLILLNLDAAAAEPSQLPAPASGEVIRLLENAALQRNPGEFSRTLGRALGISRELAERAARDPSGEPIVVAAKALGMKAAVLQRILLFLNPAIGQSVQRVYDLAQLFDELSREGAEHMLAIWRDGTTPRPTHAPVYQDDKVRDARLGTASSRSSTHSVGRPPERLKSKG